MSVVLPDKAKDVVNRMKTDVKGELPNSNPFLKNSYMGARITASGNRIFDLYYQLKTLIKMLSPFDAKDEFLQFWADIKNLVPLEAEPAKGPVTFTGTIGSSIALGSVVTVGDIEYTVDATVVVAANVKTVDTLTASAGTAFCITDIDHGFASGKTVTMAGANEIDYNGDFTITVTGTNSFTYPVALGVAPIATGTITASMDSVTANVTADLDTADDIGLDTNQDNGVETTLQSSIAGVDDIATVQYVGLADGRNIETDSEYQARIVYRWQNPLTPFNPADIERACKKVTGVTRVWVHRVYPLAGEVTYFFVRDNDDSIIPDANDIANVRVEIDAITPANTDPLDVHDDAIVAIPINIVISGISPDTTTMRNAISETINSYYRGEIQEGENNEVEKLRSAIFQTYDVQAGERLTTFTLDLPTLDQPIALGEIATEGTLTINN